MTRNKRQKAKKKPFASQITKILDQAKIKYKILEHKVVYTARDAAAATKKKLSEIAKTVLVKFEFPSPRHGEGLKKGFKEPRALIVLPASRYLDLAAIKKALKAKKVSIAGEKDIIKYLKTEVGLPHPFGSMYGIQTLLDKSLSKAKKLIASAGNYTHSVEMTVKDFEKTVRPIKGGFSRAKK